MDLVAKDRCTFKKAERLSSKTEITKLFQSSSLFEYPFKVFYFCSTNTEQDLPKILISVSKKRFRRANKRNTVKRRIREAYRLNKAKLLNEKAKKLNVGFIYVGKELHDFYFIEKKLNLILARLASQYETKI